MICSFILKKTVLRSKIVLRRELTDFCEEQLENMGNGQCVNCNHPCDNHNDCDGNCSKCFDEIHFHQGEENVREDYNCQKLIFNYVLKYYDRYTNNIKAALNLIGLEKYRAFKIFSIGCGPAPDLNAFCELNLYKRIDYYGFDINKKWKPIHKKINSIVSRNPLVDSGFRTIDIFDLIDRNEEFTGYNVLIIQYLISHLYNTNQIEQIDDLFEFIVNNILSDRKDDSPFLIIINDIDSRYKGRNYFWHLIDYIEKSGYYGKAYAISNCSSGDLGEERWTNNQFSSTYKNIRYEYITPYPQNFEGALLIIEVE